MKKDLGLIIGLAALAGLVIVLLKKSGKKPATIEGDSYEERQLLYGEMPGELVDFAAARERVRKRRG